MIPVAAVASSSLASVIQAGVGVGVAVGALVATSIQAGAGVGVAEGALVATSGSEIDNSLRGKGGGGGGGGGPVPCIPTATKDCPSPPSPPPPPPPPPSPPAPATVAPATIQKTTASATIQQTITSARIYSALSSSMPLTSSKSTTPDQTAKSTDTLNTFTLAITPEITPAITSLKQAISQSSETSPETSSKFIDIVTNTVAMATIAGDTSKAISEMSTFLASKTPEETSALYNAYTSVKPEGLTISQASTWQSEEETIRSSVTQTSAKNTLTSLPAVATKAFVSGSGRGTVSGTNDEFSVSVTGEGITESSPQNSESFSGIERGESTNIQGSATPTGNDNGASSSMSASEAGESTAKGASKTGLGVTSPAQVDASMSSSSINGETYSQSASGTEGETYSQSASGTEGETYSQSASGKQERVTSPAQGLSVSASGTEAGSTTQNVALGTKEITSTSPGLTSQILAQTPELTPVITSLEKALSKNTETSPETSSKFIDIVTNTVAMATTAGDTSKAISEMSTFLASKTPEETSALYNAYTSFKPEGLTISQASTWQSVGETIQNLVAKTTNNNIAVSEMVTGVSQTKVEGVTSPAQVDASMSSSSINGETYSQSNSGTEGATHSQSVSEKLERVTSTAQGLSMTNGLILSFTTALSDFYSISSIATSSESLESFVTRFASGSNATLASDMSKFNSINGDSTQTLTNVNNYNRDATSSNSASMSASKTQERVTSAVENSALEAIKSSTQGLSMSDRVTNAQNAQKSLNAEFTSTSSTQAQNAQKGATSTSSDANNDPDTTISDVEQRSNSNNSGLGAEEIAGIATGATAAVIGGGAGLAALIRRRRSQTQKGPVPDIESGVVATLVMSSNPPQNNSQKFLAPVFLPNPIEIKYSTFSGNRAAINSSSRLSKIRLPAVYATPYLEVENSLLSPREPQSSPQSPDGEEGAGVGGESGSRPQSPSSPSLGGGGLRVGQVSRPQSPSSQQSVGAGAEGESGRESRSSSRGPDGEEFSRSQSPSSPSLGGGGLRVGQVSRPQSPSSQQSVGAGAEGESGRESRSSSRSKDEEVSGSQSPLSSSRGKEGAGVGAGGGGESGRESRSSSPSPDGEVGADSGSERPSSSTSLIPENATPPLQSQNSPVNQARTGRGLYRNPPLNRTPDWVNQHR